MADFLSAEKRSALMSKIRSRDTGPERLLRSLVHGMGYRFRLNRRDLPGTPDLVFPGRGKVIFVHGCFWHAHRAGPCRRARDPQSNTRYWTPKLAENRRRDIRNRARLRRLGWQVLTVWECELKDPAAVAKKVRKFLGRITPSRCR